MTLTHLIPSLRSSLANPLAQDLWPEHTTTTPRDVIVCGVSLTRLTEWCGTPCVHTAASVIPNSGGVPSTTEVTSVIVTRALAVQRNQEGSIDVVLDATIPYSRAELAEARMIGRVSVERDAVLQVHPRDAHADQGNPYVCGDLRAGDLIAIPCRGPVRLRDIDPRRHPLQAADSSVAEWAAPSACGK